MRGKEYLNEVVVLLTVLKPLGAGVCLSGLRCVALHLYLNNSMNRPSSPHPSKRSTGQKFCPFELKNREEVITKLGRMQKSNSHK